VSEPVPYLGGDGEGAAFPLYLDSSIVWERGFNQSGSKFDRVELWASPLSPDPSQLEPFKVADLPLTSHAVGGSGYYAAGLDMQTVLLTHLPDGEQRVLRVPTTHRLVAPLLGIANGELYTLIRRLESSDPTGDGSNGPITAGGM